MSKSIVIDYDLPGPPAKVWRALTEPALLAAWLMESDIVAEVGHRFSFRSRPWGDWDGTVACEVLEVIPNERLVYTWVGGGAKSRLESTVTWTLTATATGTRLHLEHAGFTDANAAGYDAMTKGWRDKRDDLARLSQE